MTRKSEEKCRCCIERFSHQDSACDCYCTHCGWREHVPSSQGPDPPSPEEVGEACVKHGKRRARSGAHT